MKAEEGASAEKHGDVSPLTGSISNLPEPPSPPEPTSEKLSNFSRVTPAQMSHITFPPDSRYQPVRAVSTHPAPTTRRSAKALTSTEKYAGGGGILLLIDHRPDEWPSYIEFSTVPVAHQDQQPAPELETSRHISLDPSAPEVTTPPEAFEVSVTAIVRRADLLMLSVCCSTRLTTILRLPALCLCTQCNFFSDCIQCYSSFFLVSHVYFPCVYLCLLSVSR